MKIKNVMLKIVLSMKIVLEPPHTIDISNYNLPSDFDFLAGELLSSEL